jgi:hypothetical protein
MLMGGGETFEIARPIRRQVPSDFEVVFVQIGRLACEEHYRAERDTITRWLGECGKDRLTEKRATFWRWKRKLLSRGRQRKYDAHRRDRTIPHTIVMEASRFLKAEKMGVVTPSGEGQWQVGTSILEPAELVAFATSLGFDPVSTLSRGHVLRQIWARP